MDEAKYDPYEDFMCALHGHDTVILLLTGVGETRYSTQEVHEIISSRLNNHKRRADTAVEEVCKVCECLTNDTGHGWKNSCDECEWRGPEAGGRRRK